jgi:hypothetical protein
MSILFCTFVVTKENNITNPQDPEGQSIMKHEVTLNRRESIRTIMAIKNELERKWLGQIFMAERGFGKDYWANEIDELADILLKLRKSTYC